MYVHDVLRGFWDLLRVFVSTEIIRCLVSELYYVHTYQSWPNIDVSWGKFSSSSCCYWPNTVAKIPSPDLMVFNKAIRYLSDIYMNNTCISDKKCNLSTPNPKSQIFSSNPKSQIILPPKSQIPNFLTPQIPNFLTPQIPNPKYHNTPPPHCNSV